jgi:hypothetical protein
MKNMPARFGAFALFVAGLGAASVSAGAQAAPPFGQWASRTSTARLYVQRNAWCAFVGTTQVHGSCTWNATSRGGILTIYYPMPLEPGKVYFDIVWVNQSTITVWGEYFYRQ